MSTAPPCQSDRDPARPRVSRPPPPSLPPSDLRLPTSLLLPLPFPPEIVLRDHVVEALARDLEGLHHLRFAPAALFQGVQEDDPLAFADDLVEGLPPGDPQDDLRLAAL